MMKTLKLDVVSQYSFAEACATAKANAPRGQRRQWVEYVRESVDGVSENSKSFYRKLPLSKHARYLGSNFTMFSRLLSIINWIKISG